MKQLREYIKKEIKNLMEGSYPAPPEITSALKDTLGLNPIKRYVNGLKSANTLPPSYRAFLYNGRFLDIYIHERFLQLKLDSKLYDLGKVDQVNYAKKHLNKLLTDPVPISPEEPDEGGEEEMEPEAGGEEGGEEEEPAA